MNIVLKADKTKIGSDDKKFLDPSTRRYFEISKTLKKSWIIQEINGADGKNFRAHVSTLNQVKEALQAELQLVNA